MKLFKRLIYFALGAFAIAVLLVNIYVYKHRNLLINLHLIESQAKTLKKLGGTGRNAMYIGSPLLIKSHFEEGKEKYKDFSKEKPEILGKCIKKLKLKKVDVLYNDDGKPYFVSGVYRCKESGFIGEIRPMKSDFSYLQAFSGGYFVTLFAEKSSILIGEATSYHNYPQIMESQ